MDTRIIIRPNKGKENGFLSTIKTIPAVKVRNAWKRYIPGAPILQNLSMTVPSGTIYGLLGSSGCGKTTLLSCIVGLQNVDEGEILVFGANPASQSNFGRKLGYMPQDIALYDFLTIKESLQYFGRIFGINEEEIMEQVQFLAALLQLPDMNSKIHTLSGGQKRRSSLAASLIHNPKLLILDEPTVGLDPLLRERIWNYLLELSTSRGTTVIITTHYVEEARHSHTIGIMRNGKLLDEKCPNLLLAEHKANLLEEVVIKLCKIDQKGSSQLPLMENNAQTLKNIAKITFKSSKGKLLTDNENNCNNNGVIGIKYERTLSTADNFEMPRDKEKNERFRRIKAMVFKNFLNFFRNPVVIIASLFLPSIQGILVGLVFGKEPQHLKFGVANNEFPNWEEYCRNEIPGTNCAVDLSCKYIQQLQDQNGLDLIQVGSEAEAMEKARLGEIWGYIAIPENYTEYSKLRGAASLFADNETLEGSVIKGRLDMSHYMAGAFMMKNLFLSLEKFGRSSVEACGGDPREAELPFKFSSIYGSLDSGYVEYIVPAMLLLNINMMATGVNSLVLVMDRKQGTMDRSRVAGLQIPDILISYFLSDATPQIIQAVLGAALMIIGFSLEIKGSTTLFVLICILSGLNGQGFGFLIGTFCGDELEAMMMSMLIYLPLILYVGLIWPLEGMPKITQWISRCLSLTLAGDSMRSITSRGLGLGSWQVWPGIAILLAWTVFNWVAVYFRLRSSLKK